MNQTSSKSSVIVTVFLEKKVNHNDKIGTRKSKIIFVDMVGERNIKKTEIEGKAIQEESDCNKAVYGYERLATVLAQK